MRPIDPLGNLPSARAKRGGDRGQLPTRAVDAVHHEVLDGLDISALFDQFADHDYRGMLVIKTRRQVLSMNPVSRALLIEGVMDAVLDQSPFVEAVRAVEAILGHYNRGAPSALPLQTPISIYLRENLPSES